MAFGFIAPLFFYKTGSMIDLSLLSSEILWVTFLFYLIAFPVKYLGTYLMVKRNI